MTVTTAAILGATLALALAVVAVAARAVRARARLLREVAGDLGCPFHGSSFRGRFLGRALRGDGVDLVPRGEARRGRVVAGSVIASVGLGAVLALKEILAVAGAGARGARVLRLRLELTAPGVGRPDAARAAAAVRARLKDLPKEGNSFDLATVGGTEIVLVLRGSAASVEIARRMVELAIAESSV